MVYYVLYYVLGLLYLLIQSRLGILREFGSYIMMCVLQIGFVLLH